jgi:hypothetical protein
MQPTVDRAEANRLYWETDESVADIARRLDVSRRTLYLLVEPLPSGGTCAQCGGPLIYENRSARMAGHEACESCAADADDATEADLPAAAAPQVGIDEGRSIRIGSAALVGAAAGALLTFAVVRRR